MPFRLTDITKTRGNNFTAINYFYKGEGEDEIYRLPNGDDKNNKLIKDTLGYNNYCRLIKIRYQNFSFSWERLGEFPSASSSYNWKELPLTKKVIL